MSKGDFMLVPPACRTGSPTSAGKSRNSRSTCR
jgi:hypothetical protein